MRAEEVSPVGGRTTTDRASRCLGAVEVDKLTKDLIHPLTPVAAGAEAPSDCVGHPQQRFAGRVDVLVDQTGVVLALDQHSPNGCLINHIQLDSTVEDETMCTAREQIASQPIDAILPSRLILAPAGTPIDPHFDGKSHDDTGHDSSSRISLVVEMQLPLAGLQQIAQFAAEFSEPSGFGDGCGEVVGRPSARLVYKGMDRHGADIVAAGYDTRSILWVMRYLRIFADGDGRSEFEDVEVEGESAVTVAGVPPLLVSGPFSATGISFVEQPPSTPDWDAHVAPRRQWVIVLRGRAAVTVSSGERRELGPGDVLLFEDTVGEGHVSTPLEPDLSFAMIPCHP